MDSTSPPATPNAGQKRVKDEIEQKKAKRSKFEQEQANRDAIKAKNAPKMLELAEKALAAVHEMMALETATREEAGYEYGMFICGDNITLEDAESAICTARFCAERALENEGK